MGDGNRFMGMVELPKGDTVELEFNIDKKPMNMRSKVLIEVELVEHLYSSHRCGDFGGLVRLSDFVLSMIEAVLMAGGRSDLKIHAISNSKASSTPLFQL